MPTFIMVDGEEVDVPDDSTDEQRKQIAARHRQAKEVAGLPAGYRAMGGFASAVAEPVVGAVQGIGKALGMDTSGVDRSVADMRANREAMGTAGTVGEIGALAIPGGAGAKLASKLPQAMGRLGGLVAAEGGLGAAYEGMKGTVGEGASRLGNAARGFAGGAVGALLPAGAGRLLKGPMGDVSADVAGQLADTAAVTGKQLPLTMGQRMAGRTDLPARVVRGFEEGLTALPGSRSRKARDEAALEWQRGDLMAQADTPGLRQAVGRSGAGEDGLRQLQLARDALYDQALGATPLPARAVPLARSGALVARQVPEVQQELTVLLKNISDDFGSGNMTAERAKTMLSGVGAKARNAYQSGDYEAGDAYQAVRDDLLDNLKQSIGPQRAQLLDRADQLHARLVPREEAARMVGARRRGTPGAYTPDQLGGRIVQGGGRAPAATGRIPGQQEAERAGRVFSGTIPPVGPGTAEKLSAATLTGGAGAIAAGGTGALLPGIVAAAAPYGIDAILSSPAVARFATGSTAWQKAVLKALRDAGVRNPALGLGAAGGIAGSDVQF